MARPDEKKEITEPTPLPGPDQIRQTPEQLKEFVESSKFVKSEEDRSRKEREGEIKEDLWFIEEQLANELDRPTSEDYVPSEGEHFVSDYFNKLILELADEPVAAIQGGGDIEKTEDILGLREKRRILEQELYPESTNIATVGSLVGFGGAAHLGSKALGKKVSATKIGKGAKQLLDDVNLPKSLRRVGTTIAEGAGIGGVQGFGAGGELDPEHFWDGMIGGAGFSALFSAPGMTLKAASALERSVIKRALNVDDEGFEIFQKYGMQKIRDSREIDRIMRIFSRFTNKIGEKASDMGVNIQVALNEAIGIKRAEFVKASRNARAALIKDNVTIKRSDFIKSLERQLKELSSEELPDYDTIGGAQIEALKRNIEFHREKMQNRRVGKDGNSIILTGQIDDELDAVDLKNLLFSMDRTIEKARLDSRNEFGSFTLRRGDHPLNHVRIALSDLLKEKSEQYALFTDIAASRMAEHEMLNMHLRRTTKPGNTKSLTPDELNFLRKGNKELAEFIEVNADVTKTGRGSAVLDEYKIYKNAVDHLNELRKSSSAKKINDLNKAMSDPHFKFIVNSLADKDSKMLRELTKEVQKQDVYQQILSKDMTKGVHDYIGGFGTLLIAGQLMNLDPGMTGAMAVGGALLGNAARRGSIKLMQAYASAISANEFRRLSYRAIKKLPISEENRELIVKDLIRAATQYKIYESKREEKIEKWFQVSDLEKKEVHAEIMKSNMPIEDKAKALNTLNTDNMISEETSYILSFGGLEEDGLLSKRDNPFNIPKGNRSVQDVIKRIPGGP